MRRVAIVLAEGLLWIVIALLALVGSVIVHLDTQVGHRVVRNLANGLVTDLIAGRLEIGRVDHVGLDDIRVAHVALYDRQGTKVIQADRIVLVIDPLAGMRGELRFSHAELYHAFLKLDEMPDGYLTFLDAFRERVPTPSSGDPLHAYVEDTHLHDVTAYGTFLGLHDLRAEELEVHLRMEFTDDTKVQIYSARGKVVRPFPFVGMIDAVTADIRGDAHLGITVHARAHTGENRVAVRVLYRVPPGRPETDPSELDLLVHADPVDAPRLVDLGFDWASLFIGRARGFVRLHGPTDQLRLSAELAHDAGEVTLRGSLPSVGDVQIQAITPGVELARLFTTGPDVRIGGNVTLAIPENEKDPTRLHANTDPFVFFGYQIPAADVDANLEEDRARVVDVRAPYGGYEAHGWGTVDYDGGFDVTLKGRVADISRDSNIQQNVPGAHGSLGVSARVRADANDHYVVDAEGSVANLSYQNVRASRSMFAVHASTTPTDTQIRVDGEATAASIYGLPIGNGTVGVTGDADDYDLALDFADGERNGLHSRAHVALRGNGYRVDVPTLDVTRNGVKWSGTAEGLEYVPGSRITLGHIQVAQQGTNTATGPQLLAEGRWLARGDDDLHLEARGIDLAVVRAMFAPTAPTIAGIGDVRAHVSGDIDTHPNFTVDGQVQHGEYDGVKDVGVAFFAGYDGGTLQTDVQLDLADGGRLLLAGEGRFVASMHDFLEQAEIGDYDMTLSADRLEIGRLAPALGPDFEGTSGRAQGSLHATGSIFLQPNFQARLSIPALTIPGFETLDVDLEAQYQLGSLAAHATTSDDHGTLVEGDGSMQIDVAEAIRNPREVISSLSLMPWRFALRLPPRLASELPARFADDLPAIVREMRVAASLTMAGGGIRSRGSFVASFEHAENPERFLCARGANPRGHVVATLENDVTRATITGLVANDAAARVVLSARTPIDDWLWNAVTPAMPPVNVDVSVETDDLANIPILCENFRGPLTGQVALHGLFTDSPSLAGSLETAELRIRRLERSYVGALHVAVEDTPPIRLALSLAADAQQATVDGAVHFPRFGVTATDPSSTGAADEPCTPESHDCTSIHGEVGWNWNSSNLSPRVDDSAPIDLRATLERMPLQLPLAFISFFGRADGVVDGTVSASGTVGAPELGGRLVISEGRVDLRTLGQRLRDVRGEVVLHDGRIELRRFEARDGDGRISAEGEVGLDGFSATALNIALDASAFPVRDDGAIIAALTGHAALDATLTPGAMDGNVKVQNLDVRMPSESQRAPITLSAHPDVYIHSRNVEEDSSGPPYRLRLALDASRPFWVRSRDFSAQVSAMLDVLYADPEFRVTGTADIRRGLFEVMGKRFSVEQGSLVFVGGPEIDPEVDLVATTQLRGGANNTITVRAGGTLSRPNITFSSPLVPSGDQGQIICLLMTGSSAGQCGEAQGQTSASNTLDASQQAANFLTGVAFGLLTLSLREQFGAFIPVIAVETGSAGFQSARVRAGFNANALIPKRLRNIVQGMYIEGFFSVGGTSRQTSFNQAAASSNVITSQSVGFSMELQFPHNILGTGAFAAPNNYSFDLTWQP